MNEPRREQRPLQIADSVLDLVGRTPLVRIELDSDGPRAAVWAKCEQLEPAGSVKDRVALEMIDEAERAGLLSSGATIVEATSGNTGVALAMVCARRGYRLVLTMPASMSLERRALLAAYGVEIVLTEPERVMEGAVARAREIADERNAFMPLQFDNPANPRVHERSTAIEILDALEGASIDAFVSAVGTGGTISGVGRAFRKRGMTTRIVGVEPEQSPVLRGGEPAPSKIQGINAGFVPRTFDRAVVDEIRGVSESRAWSASEALAKHAGLLVGISSGANVAIALDVAKELGAGKTVVTMLCDTGERYFSLRNHFDASGVRPLR